MCDVSGMIDITLQPFVSALCKSCETICEKECCGIGAYSFSPFNIIYHLTKTNAGIRDRDVAEIRAELADLLAVLRRTAPSVERVVILELNAILTVEQVIALVGEIDSAISEACAIYSGQQERIDERYENFLRIIKPSK